MADDRFFQKKIFLSLIILNLMFFVSAQDLEGVLLAQSKSPVYASFSPIDDKLISSFDNSFIFWKGKNVEPDFAIKTDASKIKKIKVSGNGKYFIGIEDNIAILRDAKTTDMLARYFSRKTLLDCDLSTDGYSVALPLDGYNVSVFLRLILTKKVLSKKMLSNQNQIYSVDFNDNSKKLLIASTDNTITLWDYTQQKMLYKCQFYAESLIPSVFNKEGNLYLRSIDQNTVEIVDYEVINNTYTEKSIVKIVDMDCPVTDAIFSQDSRYVALALKNGKISIYNVNNGTKVRTLSINNTEQMNTKISSLSFNCSGDYLVCGTEDGGLYIWNIWAVTGSLGFIPKKVIKSDDLNSLLQKNNIAEFIPLEDEENLVEVSRKYLNALKKAVEREAKNQKELEKKQQEEQNNPNSLESAKINKDLREGKEKEGYEYKKDTTKINKPNQSILLNYASFGGGWSLLNHQNYIGSFDAFIRYDNMCFYPIYWGLNLIGGFGKPTDEFPYNYTIGGQQSKAPWLISIKPQFCLGFLHYMSKSKSRLFAEVFVGSSTRCLWNMSVTQGVRSSFVTDFNAGFAIGAEFKHIYIRTAYGYDTNIGDIFECVVGLSFAFGNSPKKVKAY